MFVFIKHDGLESSHRSQGERWWRKV